MKKLNKALSVLVAVTIVFTSTGLVSYAQNPAVETEIAVENTEKEENTKNKKGSIRITNSNTKLQKGSNNYRIEYKLSGAEKPCKVTFSVKDKSIAAVNSSGVVRAKGCGKTKITVKADNGLKDSIEIKVVDKALLLNANSAQLSIDKDNVERIVYGKSFQGRSLEGYVITNGVNEDCKIKVSTSVNMRSGAGTEYKSIAQLKNGTRVTRIAKNVKTANGHSWDKIIYNNKKGYVVSDYVRLIKDNTKTLFMDFAVHGFEDEYYRDGQVLVNEANALIEYFAENPKQLKNHRLVIVPCANPDGVIAGKNNFRACSNAFGRCTAEHIDINRDFCKFNAVESRRLRDFIKDCKPDIYLNMHGWLDEVIGEKTLNQIVKNKLSLGSEINNYPTQDGYIISWVNSTLKIPASLVEYRSPDLVSTEKDIEMIKAIVCSNSICNSSSVLPHASSVPWKNGSTEETVFKLNNFTQKLGSIKPKASAECYGKAGNAYIVVYSQKKAGFVKYSGGVKNAPTEASKYKNGSTPETVYADTDKKTVVGKLSARESCKCLGKVNGMYLVLYDVSGTSEQKCGFVSYNGVKN